MLVTLREISHNLEHRLVRFVDRVQLSETAILLILAVIVGIGTGLGSVLFIRLIKSLSVFFFEFIPGVLSFMGRGVLILIPAAGGLLAGPVIAYFASEAKGHGVPEVMQAIALRGGRIRPRVVVAKVIASALCIGSGGSAGREGPIVQVGSALGSAVGQLFNYSESRIRILVACGAAAGIAATFNAPIAGVIFTVEIILGELLLADIGSVIISSVTAATIARIFLGDFPAFNIPNYAMVTPWEIFLFAILGLLAALVGIFFIKILYKFEDIFDGWQFPNALKPAIGGLLLGLLGFAYPLVLGYGFFSSAETTLGMPVWQNLPHVYSSGFATIENALLGKSTFWLLLLLVFLKPLATSLTLGSGNSGGVFAPSLFTGAALGGAFGGFIDFVAPGLGISPGAYAVVGMAAVFAGAARAPFTAILIVVEMTNDYRMIVPLMAGVIVSMIVAERLHKESIYTLKLTRKGIFLRRGRDIDVMERVLVREVMHQKPDTVPVHMPVMLLAGEFIRTGRIGFPVIHADGSLFGIVSLEDYRSATIDKDHDPEKLTVGEIATRELVTVYPDESVGTALKRMAPRDLSRLPVVSRENPRQLVGLVRRNDIVRAYDVGVVRREEARRRADISHTVNESRAEFIDILLTPKSKVVGKQILDLELPREIVLVSIRRGQELVIPHGDTILFAGDIVTALCKSQLAEEARQVFI